MAKVDGSLGSLVQGVSQQPARARLPGQSERQDNVMNDEVFGMSRRPGTTTIARSNRFPADDNGQHIVEHGTIRMKTDELTYSLRIASGTAKPQLRILKDGTSQTVSLDATAEAYLSATADKPYGNRVIFKEMDDKVFVLNTQKTVGIRTGNPVVSHSNGTVIYCRGGKYAVGYRVNFNIGGTKHFICFSTPDGSLSDHTPVAQVKFIIQQLYKLITVSKSGTPDGTSVEKVAIVDANDDSWVPATYKWYMSTGADAAILAAFDVQMLENNLLLTPKVSSLSYTCVATETTGSELLVSVRDEVKNTARLPVRAPVGMAVRVVGSNRKEDDYFLKWVVNGHPVDTIVDQEGVWEECTDPNQAYRLDPATMPHELYLDGSTYKVRPLNWADRASGNDDSNPFPKFVGQTIRDIADFQGRMVVLHDNNVSMSVSSEYLDWFKQTATSKLATDPINLRSTASDGDSHLIYAVPFNRDLILFGTNNAQFMINGRRTITTDTASMVMTASFDVDLTTRPQAVGSNIMFLSWTGKFTHVHEMFLEGSENSHARRTVTDHVPRYLKGRGNIFAASDGANTAFVVCSEDPSVMYVYEFLWQDNRRVQSAWSRWVFSGSIEYVRIHQGVVTITLRTKSGAFITTTSTLYRTDAEGLPFPVHMDYMKVINMTGQTTIGLHLPDDAAMTKHTVAVIALDGPAVPGMPLEIDSVAPVPNQAVDTPNALHINLKTGYTGKVLVGQRFTTTYIPTMPFLRDRDGVAVTQAEINVTEFNVSFTDTGPFKLTRQCAYETPADYWTTEYSGQRLGDPAFVLGKAPVDTDLMEFPFDDLTTTSKLVIDTDGHLPMTITEIEWNGTIRNRYRRLTNGG